MGEIDIIYLRSGFFTVNTAPEWHHCPRLCDCPLAIFRALEKGSVL